MKLTYPIALFLMFFVAAFVHGDELILKSGKVLTGKISDESGKEYTIKLGGNMYLRVDKDEVSRVKRTKPANTSTRPIYRTDMPAAKPSSTPKKEVEKPSVINARELVSTETFTTGAAHIRKTVVFKNYQIVGSDFATVHDAITSKSSGKGFLQGKKRVPSKSEWDVSWSGEPKSNGQQWSALTVIATMTVHLPAWKAPASVQKASSEKWSEFLNEAIDSENGHLKIMEEALKSFGEAASKLNAKDESKLRSDTKTLFESVLDQTEKRRKGYTRHQRRSNHLDRKKKSSN